MPETPLDLTSVNNSSSKRSSRKKEGQVSTRDAKDKGQLSNRPEKKGAAAASTSTFKASAATKGKDPTRKASPRGESSAAAKDGKDGSSKSPDATAVHRKASPRGDAKTSAGKKTTGKKKDSDRESKKAGDRDGASTPPPPEPQSMVAVRPLVLRKTIELNSDKLGEVPVGTALQLLETRDGDSGAKRSLIRYAASSDSAAAELQGWVTSILKDGTENLAPADSAGAAAALAKRAPSPAGGAAAAGAGPPKLDTTPATAAKPAGSGATPRVAPLKATPRAGVGVGATPRGAPNATPRAGGGKPSATPRGGPGGKEVLAPVRQAPPPEVVLGGPQGFLAQPETVRAPKKDGSPTTCVAIAPPPLPGAPLPLSGDEKPPPPPEPLPALPAEGLITKPEGKRPVREDGAPSRHAIPTEWSATVEPVLLFNCANARCAIVSGDHAAFGDAQDGLLKVVGGASQEALGRVLVSSEKGAEFMTRLEFKNKWLVGQDHGLRHNGLDSNATIDVAIEWRKEDGSGRESVRLRLWPWLAYACAPGARLKINFPGHEYDGSCCTVQRVLPEDDRCVVRVDFVEKEAILDTRPDTADRTTRPSYRRGDHICVLQKATVRDAIVIEWLGTWAPEDKKDPNAADAAPAGPVGGGRHRIRYTPLDAAETLGGEPPAEGGAAAAAA